MRLPGVSFTCSLEAEKYREEGESETFNDGVPSEEEGEEILGSDEDEQEDAKDYCKGTSWREGANARLSWMIRRIGMLIPVCSRLIAR